MGLSPELRNKIFYHAVGGMVFREHHNYPFSYKVVPRVEEQPECLALLRTCRQIYGETAALPYNANLFSFSSQESMYRFFERLTIAQRELICSLQLELRSDSWHEEESLDAENIDEAFEKWLPNLKHVHVLVFNRYWSGHGTDEEIPGRMKNVDHIEFTFERTTNLFSQFNTRYVFFSSKIQSIVC